MSDELLTIKEIARQLDLPESNIRYYRDRFEDFLPYVGEGRKRRYKPEALDVFRFIVSELPLQNRVKLNCNLFWSKTSMVMNLPVY